MPGCPHCAVLSSVLLLAPAVLGAAPVNIVVDPGLLANAEVLKVDPGVAWPGRTGNYSFGEYSILSSNASPERTTTTDSLLDPAGREHTRRKYRFVMRGADAPTARVKAVQNVEAADIPDLELGSGVAIDLESIIGEVDDLAATIVIDGEVPETWVLLLNVRRRMAGTDEQTRMSVLDGASRSIEIAPASSQRPGAKHELLPARGYEFREAGRAIGALQYHGGGAFGLNKNVVCLRRDLDPRTKLLLAAAATAIMEARINALNE